ncbi:Uncharacterised protein [Pseudomonas putida]|nr:Uncharacterised protein [Pseudomonas putida]
MAALSASRLVCWEMPLITSRILPISSVLALSVSICSHDSLIFCESAVMALIASSTT